MCKCNSLEIVLPFNRLTQKPHVLNIATEANTWGRGAAAIALKVKSVAGKIGEGNELQQMSVVLTEK